MSDSNVSSLISSTFSTLPESINVLLPKNRSDFELFVSLLANKTKPYEHQAAELLEPERLSANNVHLMIWFFSIITYILAIPVAVRMFRSKAYSNVIDYFSAHLVFCAFIAWIPALILLLHHWFNIFTSRFCRLHYVILSTNETVSHADLFFTMSNHFSSPQVPIFFVLYMIYERFLYAYPSLKSRLPQWSQSYYIHILSACTWLFIMLIYALASPFDRYDVNTPLGKILVKYCSYNYIRLRRIATARSIIYFCFFFPALVLIGFVVRYFCLLRGTNQIPAGQKLWTIRVTALLCTLVFYDIYLFYLENIAETYKSFLVAALLHSTFYFVQLIIIVLTDAYWLEVLFERCICLRCLLPSPRRKTTIPVAMPAETEFATIGLSSSSGHYSLVDDNIDDEFDRAMQGPPPTLRVIV